MNISSRYILLFVGTLAIDLMLVWLAWLSIFKIGDISTSVIFLMGVASILAAVFLFPLQLPFKMKICGGLAVLGIYFFLRAFGILKHSLLAVIAGLAALGAAGLITYLASQKAESGT